MTKKTGKNTIIEVNDEKPQEELANNVANNLALIITTAQSNPFKVLIETLNGLLNDINFHFTRNGIFVKATNTPINSFVVNLEMYCKNFEKYNFYSDNDSIIKGIKLNNFYKIIKNIGSQDILSLIIDNEDTHNIKIQTENVDKGILTTYEMKILDLNVNDLDALKPQLYPVVVSLPSNQLQKFLREAVVWTTFIEIKVIPTNRLVFSFKTDGVKRESIFQEKTGFMSFMRNEKKDEIIQGVYQIESISSFAKCSSISNVVKLYLSNEIPLMIEYDVGNLGIIQLYIPSENTLEK